MRRCIWCILAALSLAAVVLGRGAMARGADEVYRSGLPLPAQPALAEDLLFNGSLERDYIWYYPNHYVAPGWSRWWLSSGDIPEYDDVRPWRPFRYDGNHAQIYFRYGKTYTAGIYQRVAVQPCTFYRFRMHGRNDSMEGANHHARLGIDLLGRTYGTGIPSLPSEDIVWSPEWTYYRQWGLHAVTAESRDDLITAIMYASPDPGYGYYDTFWDAGKLTEVAPPCYRLPEPSSFAGDGFITNTITSTLGSYLVVEWDTLSPASTQVWYSHTLTSTSPYTRVLRFPLAFNDYEWAPPEPVPECPDYAFPYASPVDQTPQMHHQVSLGPFQDGETVEFVALSRRLDGSECRTSASGVIQVVFQLD